MDALEDSGFPSDGEITYDDESDQECSQPHQEDSSDNEPASDIEDLVDQQNVLQDNSPTADSGVVQLKRKLTEEEELEYLKGMPAFTTYVKKVVAQELEAERAANKKQQPARETPRTHQNKCPRKGRSMVKSPSDTTLYAPALHRVNNNTLLNKDSPIRKICQIDQISQGKPDLVTDQIIHFIEGIHMNQSDQPGHSSTSGWKKAPRDDTDFNERLEVAKRKANNLIVPAEQFKAVVNVPTGKHMGEANGNNAGLLDDKSLDVDDQCFHVTCHIDEGLKSKIQRGEFVDLERLLPKIHSQRNSHENKMELVYKDGHSYFVPAVTDGKINGIRRWEQAFRVYAAIYSEANPARAAEIWQYVHIMNTAAASYSWENVSNYDYTFRHLMSQYPQRSGVYP